MSRVVCGDARDTRRSSRDGARGRASEGLIQGGCFVSYNDDVAAATRMISKLFSLFGLSVKGNRNELVDGVK